MYAVALVTTRRRKWGYHSWILTLSSVKLFSKYIWDLLFLKLIFCSGFMHVFLLFWNTSWSTGVLVAWSLARLTMVRLQGCPKWDFGCSACVHGNPFCFPNISRGQYARISLFDCAFSSPVGGDNDQEFVR